MRKFYTLLLVLLATGTRLLAGGGPDTYGYTWLASTDAGGPTYAWKDISATGTLVSGLADDNSAPGYFSIGFPFHYYWNDYTQMKIGSNGWVSFSNTSNIASCFPSIPTPGGASDDYLAVFMGDLNFTGAGNPGQVRTWSNGVDSFIISYTTVPFWVASGPGYTGSNTFQVILSGQDSSITYQYQTLTGYTSTPGCGSMTVGIENSTGSIGLQTHLNVTPLNNYAIKFKYPNPVLLSIKDVKANWNLEPGNKGVFRRTGILDASSNVKSVGNTNITSSITATGNIYNSVGASVFSQVKTYPTGLNWGVDSTFIYVPSPLLATEGQYRFNLATTNADDINAGNNVLNTELTLVNTCLSSVKLGYSTATTATGSINWSGGMTDDGVAVYIEPPVYPVTITTLEFFASSAGSDGFIARVYDDDGPLGAAGTILSTQNVFSGSLTSGVWNTVTLPSPITITSGGFYIASFQMGGTYFIGTDNTVVQSRRNYEILDGAWSEFRYNSDQDLMIRCNISGYPTAPSVAFTTDINPATYLVKFFHATSGATSLTWDFGDGSPTTSVVNPTHSYGSAGCYNVTLIASNACSADTLVEEVCICDAPTAAFVQSGSLLTVDFTDFSLGGPLTWFWDFGDGSTDTVQNPTHTYAVEGTYTVCLIASTVCGESDTICSTVTVGCPLPTAAFSSSVTGFDGTFEFSGTTAGSTTYSWDFGDGSTGTGDSTTHTFATEGTYYVCMIVTSVCGADTLCDSVVVTCPAPTALFSQSTSGLTVDFSYTGTGATAYAWDFGDGGTSTVANPTHTYAADGMYNVCLTVTSICGTDSFCDNTDVLVGLNASAGLGNLTVSPNPTSGMLMVSGTLLHGENLSMSLIDLSGRVLGTQAISVSAGRFSESLDLSDMPAGMYLLQLRSESGATYHRVVKE